MDKIDTPEKEKRDPDDQKKGVRNNPAGIPHDDKYREGHGETGEFDNAVEKEEIHRTDKEKNEKNSHKNCS